MILGNTIKSGSVRENPNLTVGSCSSNQEVRNSDFNVALPLDSEKAISSFKDNLELYL